MADRIAKRFERSYLGCYGFGWLPGHYLVFVRCSCDSLNSVKSMCGSSNQKLSSGRFLNLEAGGGAGTGFYCEGNWTRSAASPLEWRVWGEDPIADHGLCIICCLLMPDQRFAERARVTTV
jgi:hypothetical protein